ncbi:hypothetical protein MRX96_024501 [Rhipicephalus microplus]
MDGAFIDNEILIAAVQHRLPLWMASHRQHKDKIVKAAMWREVAAAVLPNVNIGGKRRRSLYRSAGSRLRDKFRRLFVANKKAKSGAGLDDVECITITWPYFQLLYFLKDTMQTRATSGNYVSPASLQSTSSLFCSPGAPVRPASQVQAGRQPPRPDSPTTRIGMNVQELLQDMVQFEDQCLELSEASAHSDDGASGPPGVVCPYTRSVIEAFLLTRQENRANPPNGEAAAARRTCFLFFMSSMRSTSVEVKTVDIPAGNCRHRRHGCEKRTGKASLKSQTHVHPSTGAHMENEQKLARRADVDVDDTRIQSTLLA